MAGVDVFIFDNYQDVLLEVYQKRKLRNASYSLRAFSKSLGLHEQVVGNLLAGRYGISSEKAHGVAQSLGMTPEQAKYFVLLVEAKHARSAAAKRKATQEAENLRNVLTNVHKLSHEEKFILEKWYHPAVLERIGLVPKKFDVERAAKALGLEKEQVIESLELLERQHFIEIVNRDEYVRVISHSIGESTTPSQLVRGFHKQVLSKAIEAVDAVNATERKSLSSIFSFDLSRLEEARDELANFQASFLRKYGSAEISDSVFSVTVQLFRLDRMEGS